MNKNLVDKKEKYKKLQKRVTQKYNDEMKRLKKILKVIDENSEIEKNDNLETIIFKKYLELENVTSVARYINDLGYRIKTDSYIGERKYKGTDITEILIKDVGVNKELKEVVQYLQNKNYSEMVKHWG